MKGLFRPQIIFVSLCIYVKPNHNFHFNYCQYKILGTLFDIKTYKCCHSFESSFKTENDGVKIIVFGWILTKLFNIANRTNSRITPYFANIAGARSKGVFERYEPNKNCFVFTIHYIFIIRPSILTIIKINL